MNSQTPNRAFRKTTKRVLTRRGVLWLGQTCNLRCFFCYFVERIADTHHPEHPFMSLDKAKSICDILRALYRNTAVDIQGGEPTLHPEILELVGYCRGIGLYPTLITNGLSLTDRATLEAYRDAGLRDFLVSLHGLGGIHDEVVGRTGASEKILRAIEGMRDAGIPFRFNCTMSKPVVPLLTDIARKAVDCGAYGVNYIAFNPFGDQETGARCADNVPRYADLRDALAEALDVLEDAGIEANVRYVPLCMAAPRHRKNFYNFQQLSYDTHEWDYQSWLWTMMQPQMMQGGGLVPGILLGPYAGRIYRGDPGAVRDWYARHPTLGRWTFALQHVAARTVQVFQGKEALCQREARYRAAHDCHYAYHDACARCAARNICDGFHGDYVEFFGTDEANPLTDVAPTDDPRCFIRHQEKIVEPEDEAWAL